MKKNWCRHIRWELDPYYEIKPKWWIRLTKSLVEKIPVPHSWKRCPICGVERPTRKAKVKANIEANIYMMKKEDGKL